MAGRGVFPKSTGDIIYAEDVAGGVAGATIQHGIWAYSGPHNVGDVINHTHPYVTQSFTDGGGAGTLDVRSFAVSNGWDELSPLIVTISGPRYAISTGSPAIYISGSFPWGLTLVVNSGVCISGHGGDGGNGGPSAGGGGGGGPGLQVYGFSAPNYNSLVIDNEGVIAGGGGGGGGGGYYEIPVKGGTNHYYGGGGGGGAGFGGYGQPGGAGAYVGTGGYLTGGGPGGNGTDPLSVNGGNGGGPGSAGNSGGTPAGNPGWQNIVPGGPGGPGGSAAIGTSGVVTWTGTGVTYGGVS